MSPLSNFMDPNLDEIEMEKLLETGEFPKIPIPTALIGTKVIVFNHFFASILYGFGRYFGIPVGIRKPKGHIFTKPLELTLFEALYLLKNKKIDIILQKSEKKLGKEEFYQFACDNYPAFDDKYRIYEDLRDKKYIPRPGQKFGADFIVYRKGPGIDHSSFCIQVLANHSKIGSIDVVRSARLATSVKKKFIMANPLTKSYFSFKWYKP